MLLAKVEPLLDLLIAVKPIGEEVVGSLGNASPALLAPGIYLWLKDRWQIELRIS
jgi:hypothetical protein